MDQTDPIRVTTTAPAPYYAPLAPFGLSLIDLYIHHDKVPEKPCKNPAFGTKMNGHGDEEDDHGDVFLDEDDVIQEITVDEEDLPDADDDAGLGTDIEEPDDSMHIFTGHSGEVYTVACNPNEATMVATGGGDDKAFLWKIGQTNWGFELQGHKDSVSALGFSADGELLATGSLDGLIQVWDASSGKVKCKLEGPGGAIEWLRWHPKGHLVLAGSEDSTVWMWNADNKNPFLQMFSGHGSSVTCGDFTPDGKSICTGSDDASLRIWNPRSGETIHVIKGHSYHTEGLTCLTMTDSKNITDSTLAITGSKDGSVHVVNVITGKVVSSLTAHTDSVECVAITPSFPWVATAGLDQKLIIWDLHHSSPRCTCEHEEGVTCLLWLGASQYIATGCIDGKVRVWDSLSGSCVRTFTGHSDAIQSLALSKNGDFLVSVALDQTARVFETADIPNK